MEAQNILIEPVVTEKTNLLREEKSAKYAFKVLPEANKFQIMEAVDEAADAEGRRYLIEKWGRPRKSRF